MKRLLVVPRVLPRIDSGRIALSKLARFIHSPPHMLVVAGSTLVRDAPAVSFQLAASPAAPRELRP